MEDGYHVLRFESAVTESGLRAIKTYRIPRRGFQGSLEIELVNTGESRLTFNHQGQGLGIALGPGLGKAPPPEPGFGGAHYEFTRPFYRLDADIIGLKTRKPDEPEIFVDPQGRIDLAGIQSRYFMMGVLPGETFPEGRVSVRARGRSLPDRSMLRWRARTRSSTIPGSKSTTSRLRSSPARGIAPIIFSSPVQRNARSCAPRAGAGSPALSTIHGVGCARCALS
jgi:hypothetical protein